MNAPRPSPASGMIHRRSIGDYAVLLEIDNPPRNTLGHAMRVELNRRLDEIESDFNIRAVVLTGRGEAFCSGDDLKEEEKRIGEATQSGRAGGLLEFGLLLNRIESFRVPVVAAVNGWCVGGGLELALCCDIRLASTRARFTCAGVNVGLMASAYRLPRLIGSAAARLMLYTGLPHDAATAEKFGLVTSVHEPGELVSAASSLAERIASRAPLSVEASKRMVARAHDLTPEQGAAAQMKELAGLVTTRDHTAALAAFREKRDPVFKRE